MKYSTRINPLTNIDRKGNPSKHVFTPQARKFIDDERNNLSQKLSDELGRDISAYYRVFTSRNEVSLRFCLESDSLLSASDIDRVSDLMTGYQRDFAKSFNKQPFANTMQGMLRFPTKNGPGVFHLTSDEYKATDVSSNIEKPSHGCAQSEHIRSFSDAVAALSNQTDIELNR